ncbi:endolytic transglycosylase MltG [Saccharibacter sp. EH611]|nr:endolytic transglycosylase MltG [Saccharibacter sp. EH611]MXV57841.1 endolytic transglycosylase MltG [Saccharibacter sp. EH70]MXV65245.1 endolytic transglycosylase MltG [Saccharibacter sp. EH60]
MSRFSLFKKSKERSEESSLGDDTQKCWRDYVTVGRAFFFGVCVCVACIIAGYGHYTDPGPLSEERTVVIPQGGMHKVAQTLQEQHLLSPGWSSLVFFRAAALVTLRHGGIHAAEFDFPARVSISHILYILRHGRPVTHSVTIAEGVTAFRIRGILQRAVALQGELPEITEGSVYPQTFFYRWGTERRSLLAKMQELMHRHETQVWEHRDRDALQGIVETPEQLLVLASLVERETALPAERPQVARVFLNRLKKNMRLQTDPTVIYAVSEGKGSLGRPLSHADLQYNSPYNTYENTGLPPGPICSPSRQSMEAVAHPAAGDALYFMATGRGGHSFSQTLAEHTQHVRDYRKQRRTP